MLLQALAVYARTMDDQHPRIAETLTILAALYDAWGKPAEADACRARLEL